MRPRRLAVLLIAPLGVAFAGATGAWSAGRPVAAADARFTSFDATAAADGVRVLVYAPSAPLSSNVFDGGAPVTQALVNGIGESRALASIPYPGDTALSLPSLVLPLIGLPAPPEYPLLAASSAPNKPKGTVDIGPLHMAARSDQYSSAAESSGGGGSGDNTIGNFATMASTTAATATAKVVSKAESTTEAANFGGVLSIGRVHAVANVTRPATGKSTTTSALEIEGVKAAGTTIGVTSKGFLLPGSTSPVPDTNALSPVLDAAGISLQYVQSQPITDGIVSAGLAITVRTSSATTTYILGRVRALASSTVAQTPAVSADTGVGAPAAGSAGSGSTEPASPSAAPAASTASAGLSGGTVAAPTAAAPLLAPAGRQAAGLAASRPVPTSTVSTTSFYLVLVIGALVGLVGAALVRIFGMRLV
ncbi:MAG: hypothetical protein QOH74_25 [Gaiellales bacterium]|jgi:hypothetical protein|nr:hypothetical protein [Gaiellales bacterium]